ncbi:MAG: hypothetical protein R3E39_09425 [Anaerolineae bacterium]
MSQSMVNALRLKLEDWRIRQHFKRVEGILRSKDVNHLSPALQATRKKHLDHLHVYATRGIFPRNYEKPDYAPCFIDRDGHECAVAYLLIQSGQMQAAQNISVAANYAYVPEMSFPVLDEWAKETGLSKKELAFIQPGYWSTFDGTLLSFILALWSAGLFIVLINAVQFIWKRTNIIVPIIGFAAMTILTVLGIVLFALWLDAYSLAMRHDGYPYDLPLQDAGPFGAAAVVSLGIALLAGWLSVRNARNSNHQFTSDDDPDSAT